MLATADRLVAQKDPLALFEFVRDQIVAYPPTSLDGAVTEVRWGVRGTLRGGAGTPREKAELLADLYRRAGFEASVVAGAISNSDPQRSAAARAYLREVTRTFAPAVSSSTLSAWRTQMQRAGALAASAPIDPTDAERAALVATLGALLPADAAAQMGPYDATLETAAIGQAPLVAVTVGGELRYANPLFPEAKFGDSLTDDVPSAASDAAPPPTVSVELSISTTAAPATRVSVARASYPADLLAGRQILAQFAPAMSADTLANRAVADVHAFTPVLSLRGHDLDPDADAPRVIVGDRVTTRGDVFHVDDAGVITHNGKELLSAHDVDPHAAERVATLSVSARTGAFPDVQLVVSARDAGGAVVEGLAASSFRILEDSNPVGFHVSSVPARSVRVLLAFDVDDPLATGEDPLDFARRLTTAVLSAYPGAVMVTGSDSVYVEQTDPDAVAAALAGNDPDDCWPLLADAAAQNPTVIVLVSDFVGLGDPNDPEVPRRAYRSLVASGPPVIAISTNPASAPTNPELDRLIALTNGAAVPAGGIDDSVSAVLSAIAKHGANGTYALNYTASLTGPANRLVSVAVGTTTAGTQYSVPAAADQIDRNALAGVYLSVSLGSSSVTRVLGGYSASEPPAAGVPIAPAVLDDVRSALFGASLLSFEAAAPSVSIALDELLTTKLALQPLLEGLLEKDEQKVSRAIPALATLVPAALTQMQCPIKPSNESSRTYQDGLRIVHYAERLRFGVGRERRVDILPVSGSGTIAADARTAFRDTLARSARLAIVEGHTLPTSTLSLLAGRKLSLFAPGAIDPEQLPFSGDALQRAVDTLEQYQDYYRLLPLDSGPFSGFWAVSRSSGALLGVLADASGGAVDSEACAQLKESNKVFAALSLAAGLAGVAGLGPFFFLGKEVSNVALLSAAILDDQDVKAGNANPNAPIDGLAANAACEALLLGATTGASVAGPGLGQVAGDADKLNSAGALAGASASCPSALSGVGCG